jgi:ABC-type phosphate transport system substrate-binding protein
VLVYNAPGVRHALKSSGPVPADMFRGRIANWDDPATHSEVTPRAAPAGVATPETDLVPGAQT